MSERHVCTGACRPLEGWQVARAAARRRVASLRTAGTTSRQRPDSELERWLQRRPGRCPCCAAHVATQGHDPGCLVGHRANIALEPDGTWSRNAIREPA